MKWSLIAGTMTDFGTLRIGDFLRDTVVERFEESACHVICKLAKALRIRGYLYDCTGRKRVCDSRCLPLV